MLTFMRKHAKNWMMKAVLGIIIVVFVFYFGSLQSGRQAEVVAMVGDRAITYNDYRQAYDNLLNYYREQFQGALTDDILKSLNLKGQTLNRLIDSEILLNEAARMGLTVTDEEVRLAITSYPAFQRDGRFDMSLYNQLLRYYRLTAEEFEEMKRKELTLSKVERIIREAAKVSKREVEDLFSAQYGKINLQYVKIGVEGIAVPEPDREALEAFYREQGAAFRVPEKIKVRYLAFPASAYGDGVAVPEEQIIAFYNGSKDEFLFQGSDRKPLSAVREEIVRILKSRRAMEQAEDEARKAYETIYQERDLSAYGAGNGIVVIESEWFPRNDPPEVLEGVEDVETKLSPLQKGDPATFLRDGKGFYVLEIADIKPSYQPPLEDVKKGVLTAHKGEEKRKAARRKGEEILSKLKGGEDFGALAGQQGLALSETGFFQPATSYTIPGIGDSRELANAAASLSKGRPFPERPYFVEDGFFVVRFKERETLDVKAFAEIEDQLEKQLHQYKEDEMFRVWLNARKESLTKEGKLKILVDPETL